MKQLDLILAGLPPPPAGRAAGTDLPAMPALARLLARGNPSGHAAAGPEKALARAFGLSGGETAPLARWTRLGDTGQSAPDEAGWWRADPVHIRFHRTHLALDVLDPPPAPAEAEALVAHLNAHFGDGLGLQAPTPERWYARPAAMPAVAPPPPGEVRGRPLLECLPAGPENRALHGLLNEIQMCLHDHPVNQAREAAGQPAINSLWFWGGGAGTGRPASPARRLLADDPDARTLGRLAGLVTQPLPDRLALADHPGERVLALVDLRPLLARPEAWWARALELENHLFAPLLAALVRGRLAGATLELTGEPGRRVTLTTRAVWRFWRG